jgi:hypothetical protein
MHQSGAMRVCQQGLGREELIVVAKLDVEIAQEMAEQAGKKIAETTHDVVEQGRKKVGPMAKKRARKLERKLTKAAKKLPVDTPVDRRRRSKTAGRVVLVVRLAFVAGVGLAIFLAWRARNRAEGTPAEAGPAPDAFGAAVESSDDGENAPATSTQT